MQLTIIKERRFNVKYDNGNISHSQSIRQKFSDSRSAWFYLLF